MHHNLIIKDGNTTKVVKEVLVDGIQFVDEAPREGSTNFVTSDGVNKAIGDTKESVDKEVQDLQNQIDEIAEKAGSGYIPKGGASVATLNALSGQENGELYTMTDAGTLTEGSLAVVAGDTVAWDATNGVWYKAMDYAPRQYGTNEVHSLPAAITAFRTGDVIPVDGPSGTAKMGKDDLLRVTAENAIVKGIVNSFNPSKPNGVDGYAYHKDEMVEYDGKLYYFTSDKTSGAWDGDVATETTLSYYLRVLSLAGSDAVSSQEIKISFSNVSGSAPNETADISVTSSANILFDRNSATLSSGTTFSGAAYTFGGLFAIVDVWTRTFKRFEVYGIAGSSINVKAFRFGEIAFPIAKWYKGEINFVCNNAQFANDVKKELKEDISAINNSLFFENVYATASPNYFKLNAGVVTEEDNSNYLHYVVPTDNLKGVRCVAGASNTTIPAVLFFSSEELTTANFISAIFGTEAYEPNFTRLNGDVTIPVGAKYAVINQSKTREGSYMGYWSSYSVRESLPKKNVLKVFPRKLRNGYLRYENGVVTETASTLLEHFVFPVEGLIHVKTYANTAGGVMPAVLFFSSRDFTAANLLGVRYGVSAGASAWFDEDIIAPAGTKYVVVNCTHQQTGNYYTYAINNEDYAVVSKDGSGDFTTIADAIDAVPDRFPIYVKNGTYEEIIRSFLKEVNIIGESREDCILVSYDGRHDYSTIECYCGKIENMTIKSQYVSGTSEEIGTGNGAYAVHIDSHGPNVSFADGNSMTIRNCRLSSDFSAALGCGTFGGWSLYLEDCEFVTNQPLGRGMRTDEGGMGAVLIHEPTTAAVLKKSNVTFKNCILRNTELSAALRLNDGDLADGRGIDFSFVFNVLLSSAGQDNNIAWTTATTGFSGSCTLDAVSYGNSNSDLNN